MLTKLQHVVLAVKGIISYIIPDMPTRVFVQLQRQRASAGGINADDVDSLWLYDFLLLFVQTELIWDLLPWFTDFICHFIDRFSPALNWSRRSFPIHRKGSKVNEKCFFPISLRSFSVAFPDSSRYFWVYVLAFSWTDVQRHFLFIPLSSSSKDLMRNDLTMIWLWRSQILVSSSERVEHHRLFCCRDKHHISNEGFLRLCRRILPFSTIVLFCLYAPLKIFFFVLFFFLSCKAIGFFEKLHIGSIFFFFWEIPGIAHTQGNSSQAWKTRNIVFVWEKKS